MEDKQYQLKYLEEKVNAHEERIRGVEVFTKEYTKISLMLEQQTEVNKQQSETMLAINKNLTELHHTQQLQNERYEANEQRQNERLEAIEKEIKVNKENDNVSISKTTRKIGYSVIMLIIGGFVAWGFAKLRGQ